MFSLFNLQGALQSRFHNFFSLFSGFIGFPRPKQLAHYSTSFSACQELFSFFSKLFSRLFRSPRSPAKRSAIISFDPPFVNPLFQEISNSSTGCKKEGTGVPSSLISHGPQSGRSRCRSAYRRPQRPHPPPRPGTQRRCAPAGSSAG